MREVTETKYNLKRAIPLVLVGTGIAVMVWGFQPLTLGIAIALLLTGIEK